MELFLKITVGVVIRNSVMATADHEKHTHISSYVYVLTKLILLN